MYQVGSPWILLGKRFLPVTGMPILKRARSSTPLLVWLPEPLTVATLMEKSLTNRMRYFHSSTPRNRLSQPATSAMASLDSTAVTFD